MVAARDRTVAEVGEVFGLRREAVYDFARAPRMRLHAGNRERVNGAPTRTAFAARRQWSAPPRVVQVPSLVQGAGQPPAELDPPRTRWDRLPPNDPAQPPVTPRNLIMA